MHVKRLCNVQSHILTMLMSVAPVDRDERLSPPNLQDQTLDPAGRHGLKIPANIHVKTVKELDPPTILTTSRQDRTNINLCKTPHCLQQIVEAVHAWILLNWRQFGSCKLATAACRPYHCQSKSQHCTAQSTELALVVDVPGYYSMKNQGITHRRGR